MRINSLKQWLAFLLIAILLTSGLGTLPSLAEQAQPQRYQLVLTLGADLSKDQKSDILKYFGITEDQATVVTITNKDERAQLGNLVSEQIIGKRTLSCALIRLTTSGGIQVKTANMNFVTSNMIASTLSTSGVYNCEVLTAAPFEVSGTGALTGVMMAYEAGTGKTLDPEKKSLANEELVITGEIANSIGQDQATLVVNDIKIHIVRDSITDRQEVVNVVDEVIATTDFAAAQAAEAKGMAAPAKLGTVETRKLYDFGYKFSQMGYNYSDIQPTLERVTRNITKSTGIQDPITDTFTTVDDEGLSIDSILLNTQDSVWGDDAIINATNNVALGDHPAETIEVFSGDVRLTEAGKIKAESFIKGSNLISFKDTNGLYALMDLNGNILTESIYTNDFHGYYYNITAKMSGPDGLNGILNSNGNTIVPFQYDVVDALGTLWGVGIRLTGATDDDYDYYGLSEKYKIDTVDIYYFGDENNGPIATLTRDAYAGGYATGDYVNIMDRNGTVTTFDSSFQAVQHPNSLYDSTYDEANRAAEVLSSQLGGSVGRFKGNYAVIHKGNKAGVVDKYGNIIVPIEFDTISSSSNDELIEGGYVSAEQNDHFVYTVQGGAVTGNFPVSLYDVSNYGMAAYMKADDGSYTLFSGDGITTNLGTTYKYLSAISESKGMLWKGELPEQGYDLLDWHGNVLISGCDDYSVSANGNYVIAQDGYTSSTLYLVNDASPVSISDSIGGATELTVEIKEGASLEAYTGEPSVEFLGIVPNSEFIDGTELIKARSEYTGQWMIQDVSGKQLTEAIYTNGFEYKSGWLIVAEEKNGSTYAGLLSMTGAQVLPCEYDVVDVLNENWAVAYTLVPTGTKDDYDFRNWGNDIYYQIDTALVCHLTPTEVSSVKLGRDQIADIEAQEDYINVQDRKSGAVTTYDSSFNAVATVKYTSDFKGFSKQEVLEKTIKDQLDAYVFDGKFPDGYSRVSVYSGDKAIYGVVDMNGNIIVPLQFDRVESWSDTTSHIWANGYFCVEKDGLFGYVTENGIVTCELTNSTDFYMNEGMAASVKQDDGTYNLVAADGTITEGYEYLYCPNGGRGLLWEAHSKTGNGYDVVDWHGNVLFENISDISVSFDGHYLLVEKDYNSPTELYGIDGSVPEGGFVGAGASSPEPEATEIVPEEDVSEEQPEQDPAETEAVEIESTPEPETGSTGTLDAVNALLTSAKSLVSVDVSANRTAIETILNQVETMIAAENPGAAALISSAITLLSMDDPDASALSTLLDTAMGML